MSFVRILFLSFLAILITSLPAQAQTVSEPSMVATPAANVGNYVMQNRRFRRFRRWRRGGRRGGGGGGGAAAGGAGGAPIPALGATLIGQALALGGFGLAWRIRRRRRQIEN